MSEKCRIVPDGQYELRCATHGRGDRECLREARDRLREEVVSLRRILALFYDRLIREQQYQLAAILRDLNGGVPERAE